MLTTADIVGMCLRRVDIWYVKAFTTDMPTSRAIFHMSGRPMGERKAWGQKPREKNISFENKTSFTVKVILITKRFLDLCV